MTIDFLEYQTMPDGRPFLLPGGRTGCLLLHGSTAMPAEMRYLGDFLHARGLTVLGQRLAGHGTHPRDLYRTRWQDWLTSIEDGLAILSGMTDRIFIAGLSLGGALALLAAARYPLAGVIAMAAPVLPFDQNTQIRMILQRIFMPWVRKFPNEPDHPLKGRREINYPAYPAFPSRMQNEGVQMIRITASELPRVQCPALLIYSNHDPFVPVENADYAQEHLGSTDKTLLRLDHFDHAIPRDPKREVPFAAIAQFLERLSAQE